MPPRRADIQAGMKPRWKLTVEGLGKIERAEVDLRPLTLFIGPNNSGKSYLASLLWGLVAMQADLELPEGPARDAVDAWVEARIGEGKAPGEHDLTAEDIALFDRYFEVALEANRTKLVKRIFHSDLVTIRQLSFCRVWERRAKLSWSEANGSNTLSVTDGRSLETSTRSADLSEVRALARDMLTRRLTYYRLTRLFRPFEDAYSNIDPVYLPASRTGFMQLYKAAARRSFRDAFRREETPEEWLELTTPAFHFLDMIAFGLKDKRESRYAEEASFLEQAMNGKIELVQTKGVNEYRYHPTGAQMALPMNLSSALVTELAPLVLVLRHVSSLPVLFLEEPEAHLHPELQRRVAQIIARLIRKGLFVWITTHSENFCQELNNFIKLGSLAGDKRAEAQRKLGYDPDDYLDLEEVAGYEFKPDGSGQRSAVAEMKRTEAGLVMPSFNRAIIKLSKDVAYLDNLLSDEAS